VDSRYVRRRVARRARRHLRALAGGGVLLAVAVVMIVGARLTRGFNSDLLLNLGASVVLAALSYMIFDPIFEEARTARVEEHERFDLESFIDVIRDTAWSVRILDTWTILLEDRHRARTLDAMRAALAQGAQVRVLLLDPDSAAAQQRAEELQRRHINVAAQIMDNLRHLHDFRERLPADLRGGLQVNVYDASPSIQLYQWDGRALISFFPIGKVSFDVPQLEVDMASPWGRFVDGRFEELWDQQEHIRPLDSYWRLPVTLTHWDGTEDTFTVPYVSWDNKHVYIDGTGRLANRIADYSLLGPGAAAGDAEPFAVSTSWPPRLTEAAPQVFDLNRLADQQSPSHTEVVGLFELKYGGYPQAARHEAYLLQLLPRQVGRPPDGQAVGPAAGV